MLLDYHRLLRFVQQVLPDFRLTRQRNLALLALGISRVRDGHLTVSEIARYIPNQCDHWYKFKRMRRFLCNPRWHPQHLFGPLIAFLVARFHPGRYLPIIIDQSTIAGKWEVIWACVPFRGRTLPIAFHLFSYRSIRQDPQGSQNRLEERFLRRLVRLLPQETEPLFLLDRGYARASLIQLLETLPVRYVVRTRKNVWIQHRDFQGPLGELSLAPGSLQGYSDVVYGRSARLRVRLALARSPEAEEPWYLVTNLSRADSALRWYERRFRCEELFRDLKDQLHLETIRLTHLPRIARLLFGLVILYIALTLLGAGAQQHGWRKKVCKDKVSLAWMALRLLGMPWLLSTRFLNWALYKRSWSLSYESG